VTERESRPIRLEALAYGGDYNPDQWTEETWLEDARLMSEAGVNLVTLPVFAWPLLEPTPGTFDFGWLDRVIEILWGSGIRIDLATATATPPAWLLRAHPEMLPMTVDGVRLEFGSRQAYCPSSPILRDNVARIAQVMAERYGAHPALAMWHISNEYGDHVSRCWCPVTAGHFREWLGVKYGNIDGLNEAWGTTVWGQHYGDWGQIEPPRTATGPINPTQQLDFERFSSDAMFELFQTEVRVLRNITPEIPVTTNFMSFLRDLNYWDFAAVEDVVTDDAYPDPADPEAHIGAALNYGLMRSLKGGQPWLLLEQAPGAVSWRDVNVARAPGQMRLGSMQALAHGSDGVMFFQWRAARFGPEKFHSAMLGHRAEAGRSFVETKALGAELKRLESIRGTRVRSSVALVGDWDSWWGTGAPDSLPSQRLNWLSQAREWNAALFALGHPVDIVRADGPFGNHAVVVVPNLYIATEAQAAALAEFVHSGGHIVVGPFSGVVDPSAKVHLGGAPGPLRKLLGVEIDEFWPLSDGDTGAVTMAGAEFTTRIWTEWLDAVDADIIASYGSGDLTGRPAVTRRRHGAGTATYLSAVLDAAGLAAVFGGVLDAAGLPHRNTSDGRTGISDLEVVTRTDGTMDYTFVLNHGRTDLCVEAPPGSHDLLTGADVGASITLTQFGVAVLRHPSELAPSFLNPTTT
jgi:beta-galactosidase